LTTRHLLGSQGSADQVKLAVMTPIELPARPRILVISLRRLGDVLLTTPLIRSLRRAWPDATIEALVFANTVGKGSEPVNWFDSIRPISTDNGEWG